MSVQYSAIHDGLPVFNTIYPTIEKIVDLLEAKQIFEQEQLKLKEEENELL